jgi:hypothetical protein
MRPFARARRLSSKTASPAQNECRSGSISFFLFPSSLFILSEKVSRSEMKKEEGKRKKDLR